MIGRDGQRGNKDDRNFYIYRLSIRPLGPPPSRSIMWSVDPIIIPSGLLFCSQNHKRGKEIRDG